MVPDDLMLKVVTGKLDVPHNMVRSIKCLTHSIRLALARHFFY